MSDGTTSDPHRTTQERHGHSLVQSRSAATTGSRLKLIEDWLAWAEATLSVQDMADAALAHAGLACRDANCVECPSIIKGARNRRASDSDSPVGCVMTARSIQSKQMIAISESA